MTKYCELFDPAPRELSVNTFRFEGEEEIDGRPCLSFLVKSDSRVYGVYWVTYMVDTREVFCACEGLKFKQRTLEEIDLGTGPLITRPDDQLCRHAKLVKHVLLAMARKSEV